MTKEFFTSFSDFMLLAALEGRKTQMRRLAMQNGRATKWTGLQPGNRIWVKEDWSQDCYGAPMYRLDSPSLRPFYGEWKPAQMMPREACRLVLEVLSVELQRLQDITRTDARHEGISGGADDARELFAARWDAFHGEYAWQRNPQVIAVNFRPQVLQPVLVRGLAA